METLFIGKKTIFLSESESTNSYAIDLLKNVNLHEGTVVQAARQTAGRGQRGNAWLTQSDCNLTASVILKPGFLELKRQFFLYKIAALACREAIDTILEGAGCEVRIKWPNDILVNGRKIAGILIENNVSERGINWTVIGIGVNVNQETFEGLPHACSLKQITGRDYETASLLTLICSRLEHEYLALKAKKYDLLSRKYMTHLFGLSATREFIFENSRRNLLVKGVSETGLLHLQDETGREIEADVKQLEWVME
jgi:BirA family transcriptional regulator, biotin operon repressor / biotin---[acetyl-CoA-carboxylase] ligase